MAVTSFLPGQITGSVYAALANFLGHAVKVMLLDSGYTPNQDTDVLRADVVAHEVTGTNYTSGGKYLTGKTATYDSGTKKTTFDADDAVWPSSTITAHYAAVYDADGAGQPLLQVVNFGGNVASSSSTFTVTWPAGGLFTGTVAAI